MEYRTPFLPVLERHPTNVVRMPMYHLEAEIECVPPDLGRDERCDNRELQHKPVCLAVHGVRPFRQEERLDAVRKELRHREICHAPPDSDTDAMLTTHPVDTCPVMEQEVVVCADTYHDASGVIHQNPILTTLNPVLTITMSFVLVAFCTYTATASPSSMESRHEAPSAPS